MILLPPYQRLLLEHKIWITKILRFALITFSIGLIFPWILPDSIPGFVEGLEKAFEDILAAENQGSLTQIWLIFRRNFAVAGLQLFLGVLLGLVPRFVIGVNTFILGFLASVMIKQSWLSLIFFVGVLIPHGIFEIPALIVTAAFGLKLGFFWKTQQPQMSVSKKFLMALKENLVILPLIIILLGLAAVIEVLVSGPLTHYLAPHIFLVP